ncbi:uncharacterized protein LOC135384263 [Ornithodoros turicata]|uniref:uncharacterized protein LOC135384263 n=1 Tax=Ornithodoros turicata TaxID=34597 RepID=UPI003138D24B
MGLFESSHESWFPKHLVIHAENETKSFAGLSPFLVAKTLEQVVWKSYNARKPNTGDLQVEVGTRQQSTSLCSLKTIGETPVSVTVHRSLNTVKGGISASELLPRSDSEMTDGLKDHGVFDARRIIIRREGKEIPTPHVVLTFELYKLPSSTKAGYVSCPVRPYVPNPRRCFKCQRFGHGSQVCRGQAVCPKCAETNHTSDSCQNALKCANCQGGHAVYSRSCPRWQEEKQILKVKAEQKITYRAAKAQVEFQRKSTFSEVVRRGVAPLRVSVETQTSEPPPHTPQHETQDTEVSLKSSLACQMSSQETASASCEADGMQSIWGGATQASCQGTEQNKEVEDDESLSQKSSSSQPGVSSLGNEQREKTASRGRGKKVKETPKMPPPRITPP